MKKSKLAIFNGPKSINITKPHYIWPIIDKEIQKALIKQLKKSISIYDRSGIIKELEDNLCDYFNVKYAVLTNSGTSALYSMYVAFDLKKEDEIICPCYTFFATLTPIFFTNAKMILVDIDKNGNIDPLEIEKKITSKTKALVITHMWGMPCNMDAILDICKKHKLLLLEDGSHAHGATYKNKKIGSFGNGSAFSLQAQKTLTGGEGGVFLTNDSQAYYRALLLGHYNKRCLNEIDKKSKYYKYALTGMGLKFRIHPLAAVIANEQLKRIDSFLDKRRKMAKYMNDFFKTQKAFKMIYPDKNMESSWYAAILIYNAKAYNGLDIQTVYDALKKEGMNELDRPKSTSPLNLIKLFQTPNELFSNYHSISYKPNDFPKAEKFYNNCFKLPVWHDDWGLKIFNMYIKAFEKLNKNYLDLLYIEKNEKSIKNFGSSHK